MPLVYFLYGISGPFMAALLDVIGLKKMMISAMSTLVLGMILTFFHESIMAINHNLGWLYWYGRKSLFNGA
ncbi:hypothetical protein OL548_28585 [Lysinibacillus sp. MHQ-1]|nr:hypothetical protein OL548_28585 [Lysinibacillus sp. MHQ-1]